MKCFDPTNTQSGSASVIIGARLLSTVNVGSLKKNSNPFVQCLRSKKIGIKASCGRSKNKVLLFGLLGFHPDNKTPRQSDDPTPCSAPSNFSRPR
jgi:hypothetical protein